VDPTWATRSDRSQRAVVLEAASGFEPENHGPAMCWSPGSTVPGGRLCACRMPGLCTELREQPAALRPCTDSEVDLAFSQ
jgi:hypothetical protein